MKRIVKPVLATHPPCCGRWRAGPESALHTAWISCSSCVGQSPQERRAWKPNERQPEQAESGNTDTFHAILRMLQRPLIRGSAQLSPTKVPATALKDQQRRQLPSILPQYENRTWYASGSASIPGPAGEQRGNRFRKARHWAGWFTPQTLRSGIPDEEASTKDPAGAEFGQSGGGTPLCAAVGQSTVLWNVSTDLLAVDPDSRYRTNAVRSAGAPAMMLDRKKYEPPSPSGIATSALFVNLFTDCVLGILTRGTFSPAEAPPGAELILLLDSLDDVTELSWIPCGLLVAWRSV